MKTLTKEDLKQLYDKDYPLWVEINLELIKDKAFDLVDWDNMIEEIEDMGRSDLKACISHLAVILEHLYKLDNFKDLAGGRTAGDGWIRSIRNARVEIEFLLESFPSLRNKLPREINTAWSKASKKLKVWIKNNGLNPENFYIPQECPYSYEEIMNREI
ncbi:MAG: DUF29 domain-containing protein [Hydrogenothermaceae bacterium]|nr:DUF29 domain-containing protein [Hydrogenothermaceae bacterium]